MGGYAQPSNIIMTFVINLSLLRSPPLNNVCRRLWGHLCQSWAFAFSPNICILKGKVQLLLIRLISLLYLQKDITFWPYFDLGKSASLYAYACVSSLSYGFGKCLAIFGIYTSSAFPHYKNFLQRPPKTRVRAKMVERFKKKIEPIQKQLEQSLHKNIKGTKWRGVWALD